MAKCITVSVRMTAFTDYIHQIVTSVMCIYYISDKSNGESNNNDNIERTDHEQIRSRINNNDCRTFQPRRPLSTTCKTKETAV